MPFFTNSLLCFNHIHMCKIVKYVISYKTFVFLTFKIHYIVYSYSSLPVFRSYNTT